MIFACRGAYDDLGICFVDASGHGTTYAVSSLVGGVVEVASSFPRGSCLLVFARGLTFFEWEVSLFCATFKCVVDFLGDIRYIKREAQPRKCSKHFLELRLVFD